MTTAEKPRYSDLPQEAQVAILNDILDHRDGRLLDGRRSTALWLKRESSTVNQQGQGLKGFGEARLSRFIKYAFERKKGVMEAAPHSHVLMPRENVLEEPPFSMKEKVAAYIAYVKKSQLSSLKRKPRNRQPCSEATRAKIRKTMLGRTTKRSTLAMLKRGALKAAKARVVAVATARATLPLPRAGDPGSSGAGSGAGASESTRRGAARRDAQWGSVQEWETGRPLG